MISLLIALLGLALVVIGVLDLLGGSVILGIVLIVVGLVLLGARYGGSVL